MALANPIPTVQGSRILHGIELQEETMIITPGISDYVTNGYVITAAAARLKLIQSAWIAGLNATASGFTALPIFALAQIGAAQGGAGFTGYSQFLLKVLVVTTGVEVVNGGNLTGCSWQVIVRGF